MENVEVSRDEMSTVLETAHEGIFALDQKGYVKHCNNRAATLFGTNKGDLIGKTYKQDNAWKPGDKGPGYRNGIY